MSPAIKETYTAFFHPYFLNSKQTEISFIENSRGGYTIILRTPYGILKAVYL